MKLQLVKFSFLKSFWLYLLLLFFWLLLLLWLFLYLFLIFLFCFFFRCLFWFLLGFFLFFTFSLWNILSFLDINFFDVTVVRSFNKNKFVLGVRSLVFDYHIRTSTVFKVICLKLMITWFKLYCSFSNSFTMESHIINYLFTIDPEFGSIVWSSRESVFTTFGDKHFSFPFRSEKIVLEVLAKFHEFLFSWEVNFIHCFNEIWFNALSFETFSVGSFFEIPESSNESVSFLLF